MKKLLLAALIAASPSLLLAEEYCMKTHDFKAGFWGAFQESIVFIGIMSLDKPDPEHQWTAQIWINVVTGTWTLVYANEEETCLQISGQGGTMIQPRYPKPGKKL